MLKVNDEECIGCGSCAASCPKCFKMNDDNKSEVIAGCDETKCDIDNIITACPVSAISK